MPLAFSSEAPLCAYRTWLGDWEVTAVMDGHIDIDVGKFAGDPAEIRALLDAEAISFVVNMGDRLCLVDAGTGGAFGDNLGKLPRALAAAGFPLEAFDDVLITHMHPDHLFGVTDADGRRVFPNATLHIQRGEYEFWSVRENSVQHPAYMAFLWDAVARVMKPYEGAIRLFDYDRDVVPGVSPIAMHGHTPGHCGFRAGRDGETLLFWGDLCHVAAVQGPHPHCNFPHDLEHEEAARSRQAILKWCAEDKIRLAGSHLPFPGIGYIKHAARGFRFVPEPWHFSRDPVGLIA
jgi:glyoxylase-like metal-dependent hydrolase (beta-lactamase superfamily II)